MSIMAWSWMGGRDRLQSLMVWSDVVDDDFELK